MVGGNYVERDNHSGDYGLGLACLELAQAYQVGSDIRQVALPEVERLRDDTKETVHLAVLDRMEVVYVEKLNGWDAAGGDVFPVEGGGRRTARVWARCCWPMPTNTSFRSDYEQTGLVAYSQATIQRVDALMDHLEEVRRQGYALDRGEHEVEVRCVAAPVFDAKSEVVAAISVAGPAGRMEPLEAHPGLIDRTLRAARAISSRLGYREPNQETRQVHDRSQVSRAMQPGNSSGHLLDNEMIL